MDRRRRMGALAVALVVLVAALGIQAATADPTLSGEVRSGEAAYPGGTLITVQSFGWFDENNGKAFVVNESGDVVWEFDPPDSRVFDGEALDNGNFLFSVATYVPAEDCPEQFLDAGRGPNHCVHNRVVEVDRESKRVVWNYSWYDAFIHWHEVHDADRLPSGETAIIDMGNNRAFTVNRSGGITWAWSAERNLGPGSAFWEEYVPAAKEGEFRQGGPESDWTHMNDIDRLSNGHFQLSIRNFDVVITVDPTTNEVVDVVGRPDAHDVMREQHNPHRIEGGGTLLVADSENDRVVEVDADTGEVIWSFEGADTHLQWPRDADRLPNGNTLITDSRNFRVLEVNSSGSVVWEYSLAEERGIAYDADRLGVPEEPGDVPSARAFNGSAGPGGGPLGTAVSWARFVLPVWVGLPELLTIVGAALVGVALVVDAGLLAWRRR